MHSALYGMSCFGTGRSLKKSECDNFTADTGNREFLNLGARLQFVIETFQRVFGKAPRVSLAPGRVNLIGEHTDYNAGFVMPAAIGLYTWVAAAARDDNVLSVRSDNFDEGIEVDLNHLPARASGHWADYVVGVILMLGRSGMKIRGANLLLHGDVPQGAGLSSSASLEVALAFMLLQLSDVQIDRRELALLCQKAENDFVGARCGIMDQFIAAHGKKDHALLLDCRSLDYELLPLPTDVRLVVCNSMIRHSIAQGEYNQRRAECEAGVRYLAKRRPGLKTLRDVSLEELGSPEHDLPEKIWRRCRHVISENTRVQKAAAALRIGDRHEFGTLMQQSHESLRDDFEVSCSELDLLVKLAEGSPGVYGARMTGGGFGGCTINLVQAQEVEEFEARIIEGYKRGTGIAPHIYVSGAVDGVENA
jgi:galactokinase